MKKNDLKPGMIVQFRCLEYGIVFPHFIAGDGYFRHLSDYSDDLNCINEKDGSKHEDDIMAVYYPEVEGDISKAMELPKDPDNILWERSYNESEVIIDGETHYVTEDKLKEISKIIES